VYSQSPAETFATQRSLLDEVSGSLALERPEFWSETRDDEFAFSIRMPPTWKLSRRLSGGRTLLMQFTSPALLIDKGGQTVHAALTLSVEPTPPAAGVQGYYDATRLKLGDAFNIVSHAPWKAGFVDVMSTETPISASRVKRFYEAAGARGYSLAFEARADAFGRANRWCDTIASTFEKR
jgi:hypothetical protein